MRSDIEVRGGDDERSVVNAPRLEEMWPVARRRIVTSLCAAGVDRDAAEEAVAEAAARALARGLVVADIDEFCRWAFVVARNEVWRGTRKWGRVVPLDVLPEQADHYDMASHVESRARLEKAVRVIREMSLADRGALLESMAGLPSPEERKAAVKHAVRRHRARSRLRDALGAPAGWLGSPAFRRWTTPFSRISPEGAAAFIALPFVAAALSSAPKSADVPSAVVDAPLEMPMGVNLIVQRTDGDTSRGEPDIGRSRTQSQGHAAAPEQPPEAALAPLPPPPETDTVVFIDTGHNVDARARVHVFNYDGRPPGAAAFDNLPLKPPG